MGTIEKIEDALRDIIASLQAARLYSTVHLIFKNSVAKAYRSLQDALAGRTELVIGIIGEELVFEKEVFFELSKMAHPVIVYFKERGIERIVFYSNVQEEELEKFITFLIEYQQDLHKDPEVYLNVLGIKNITAGKIKGGDSNTGEAAGQKVAQVSDYLASYNNYKANISQTLETILNNEALDYLILRLNLKNIMEDLMSRHQELLKLTTVKRYDLGTFSHIINVAILAMHFSSRLGFNREDVLDIGTAGLFHDIGKLYVSRKIITKQDKLTAEEFGRVKSHVILGAEILLKYVDKLGVLPVVVAFEHHVKYDLTGYPKLTFPERPHIASLIVSICDVYDALFQRRSYKSDYTADAIYNFMVKEKGRLFEPSLLDYFFKIMGVWPIGTIVVLNDSRVAVVRQENENDIFSPKVEVIKPEDKKGIVDLAHTKPNIKIERALNPFTEAKEYLPFI